FHWAAILSAAPADKDCRFPVWRTVASPYAPTPLGRKRIRVHEPRHPCLRGQGYRDRRRDKLFSAASTYLEQCLHGFSGLPTFKAILHLAAGGNYQTLSFVRIVQQGFHSVSERGRILGPHQQT